jgi:hypothetical protein
MTWLRPSGILCDALLASLNDSLACHHWSARARSYRYPFSTGRLAGPADSYRNIAIAIFDMVQVDKGDVILKLDPPN